MRRTLALTFALAATAVAATTTVIPGVSVAATPDTVLKWGPCPETITAPRLQCATLEVPLDYRHPDGRRIDLTISRLPSEKPAQRRGVLLTNPGGPGGGGLSYPADLAASGLPQAVLDSYDVIGLDPRGIGESTPVTCDLTQEQQQGGNFAPIPRYAHTDADVAREAGNARKIAKQCATSKTSWMLPHTTTANTARDMDRIREALGERKLSYLGVSYGTYLGAVYATMFPERGDRIVLDSNLGPDGYDVTAMRLFARGLEDRFPDFAAFAAARPEYGLGSTPEQVKAKFFELADRLDANPVHGIDGMQLRSMTFSYLYADATLPLLAASWQALDNGRPVTVPPMVDLESRMSGRFHVICGDTRWPGKIKDYQRNAAVDREKYPMLGGSTGNISPCAYWPRERVEPPVKIGDKGPSNMLLVQNERDPGTPLAGAKKLRQALGQRATMVTADNGGHGVFPFARNTCVNDAATTFLTDGRRPSGDLACAAEPKE